jgi:hypothetical protein
LTVEGLSNNFDFLVLDTLIVKITPRTGTLGRHGITLRVSDGGVGTRVDAFFIVNVKEASGIDDAIALPEQFALSQNYPNPFNPETSIQYALPQAAIVELIIYDIRGRRVRRLVSGRVEAGFHRVRWDGKDERGNTATSGIYFYRIQAAGITEPDKNFQSIKKMVIIK